MTPSEAAQQVADLLNELKRHGVMATMGDWPECHVSMSSGFGDQTVYRQVVWREDGWVVSDGA